MSDTGCKIQMLDLYFSKYDFQQVRGNQDTKYQSSFKIEYAVHAENDSKVRITIDTTVRNSSETVTLFLQTVGEFLIDQRDMEKDTYQHLIKANTVAIMFPFIRSQISLLTTQPGMMPVMLPPLNINALVDESEE